MEFTKIELEVVQQIVPANEHDQNELNDLQLALVGGGIADIAPI
jgi:hypothetical protein